jgi:hypothetical protein
MQSFMMLMQIFFCRLSIFLWHIQRHHKNKFIIWAGRNDFARIFFMPTESLLEQTQFEWQMLTYA